MYYNSNWTGTTLIHHHKSNKKVSFLETPTTQSGHTQTTNQGPSNPLITWTHPLNLIPVLFAAYEGFRPLRNRPADAARYRWRVDYWEDTTDELFWFKRISTSK